MENVSEIKISYRPTKQSLRNPIIGNSKMAFDVMYPHFDQDTIHIQERFIVAFLTNSNQVKGVYSGFNGGITSTIVDIRIILAIALKTGSTGILLAHNHPSGILKPSENDKQITERIKCSCKVMDLILMDHLIINPVGEYYSFADESNL